ncbi:hypothetical protein [Algoriphagus sp. Y33]|uniref:hypothetical protein n=1 Tax=Algoriphagus sp. Y33 TaxID=2772483 RepID=UPI00177B37A9|nr:hypothetical protein [Algoriphagus sp. Y33]
MKKLLILLIVVSCFFSPSYSQELDKIPYIVKEVGLKKLDEYSGFIGSDENGLYLLRESDNLTGLYGTMTEVYIDYFNTDFELQNSIYLEGYYAWLHMPRSLDRVEFVHLSPQGKLYLGYTTFKDW